MLHVSELVVHCVRRVYPCMYDSWCVCGGCQQSRHNTPARAPCPFFVMIGFIVQIRFPIHAAHLR